MRRRALSLLSILAVPAGCARCTSSPSVDGGAPPPAPLAPLLPSEPLSPPSPWTFARERREFNVALPEHCRSRGPLVRAPVPKRTRFVAYAEALGTLVIADVADRPARVTGAAALTLDPEGPSHDPQPLPWLTPSAVPRSARLADGSWIAGFDRPGEGGTSRVGLFHNGIAEPLGEGDAFEAVDLRCAAGATSVDDAGYADAGATSVGSTSVGSTSVGSTSVGSTSVGSTSVGSTSVGSTSVGSTSVGSTSATSARCALLTSRIGKVAPAGALVWIGSPADPAARWRQVEIEPSSADSDARPFALAALDDRSATVILAGSEGLSYLVAGDGAPREVARIAAPHGVIDAAALPTPVAMVYATPLSEDGCARESLEGGGAGIHFARPGSPPALVRTPAPPLGGAIRRLATGAVAAWVAPLGCGQTRRVVFAVVLDAEGKPVSTPMAVADATSFAIAADGADVDLFLQDDAQVSWVRMRCAS